MPVELLAWRIPYKHPNVRLFATLNIWGATPTGAIATPVRLLPVLRWGMLAFFRDTFWAALCTASGTPRAPRPPQPPLPTAAHPTFGVF